MKKINPRDITIIIGRKEAEDFLNDLENSLQKMNRDQIESVYLYVKDKNAIAISFDSNWHTFIGYTHGYNHYEDRTPFRTNNMVISTVRKELKNCHYSIAGGRVFLAADRAYHINEDLTEDILCGWKWLGNSKNLVEAVKLLLKKARALHY